jgi:hypothetical protein
MTSRNCGGAVVRSLGSDFRRAPSTHQQRRQHKLPRKPSLRLGRHVENLEPGRRRRDQAAVKRAKESLFPGPRARARVHIAHRISWNIAHCNVARARARARARDDKNEKTNGSTSGARRRTRATTHRQSKHSGENDQNRLQTNAHSRTQRTRTRKQPASGFDRPALLVPRARARARRRTWSLTSKSRNNCLLKKAYATTQ